MLPGRDKKLIMRDHRAPALAVRYRTLLFNYGGSYYGEEPMADFILSYRALAVQKLRGPGVLNARGFLSARPGLLCICPRHLQVHRYYRWRH